MSVCNWTFQLLQHWGLHVSINTQQSKWVCVAWENTQNQFCLKRPLIQEFKPIILTPFLKYCLGNIKNRKHMLALKQPVSLFTLLRTTPKKLPRWITDRICCSLELQFIEKCFPGWVKKGYKAKLVQREDISINEAEVLLKLVNYPLSRAWREAAATRCWGTWRARSSSRHRETRSYQE